MRLTEAYVTHRSLADCATSLPTATAETRETVHEAVGLDIRQHGNQWQSDLQITFPKLKPS